jgi:hypothetical protein
MSFRFRRHLLVLVVLKMTKAVAAISAKAFVILSGAISKSSIGCKFRQCEIKSCTDPLSTFKPNLTASTLNDFFASC